MVRWRRGKQNTRCGKPLSLANPGFNYSRARSARSMHLRIEGRWMPDNPRSSALTAMSVVHAIRNRLMPIGQ
jgi:hypothetical protein